MNIPTSTPSAAEAEALATAKHILEGGFLDWDTGARKELRRELRPFAHLAPVGQAIALLETD